MHGSSHTIFESLDVARHLFQFLVRVVNSACRRRGGQFLPVENRGYRSENGWCRLNGLDDPVLESTKGSKGFFDHATSKIHRSLNRKLVMRRENGEQIEGTRRRSDMIRCNVLKTELAHKKWRSVETDTYD